MEKLNYKEVANTQRWKDVRNFFAANPQKEIRAAYLADLRLKIKAESEEYMLHAIRNRANMELLNVLENYEHGILALRDVDGVQAY